MKRLSVLIFAAWAGSALAQTAPETPSTPANPAQLVQPAVELTRAQIMDIAMRTSFSKDWDTALAQAAPAGLDAVDVIEWMRLRDSAGTFQDTIEFLRRHPDWPGLPLLRKRSEKTIPADANVSDVLGFFAVQAPRTGLGSLRLAQAFRALGREAEAQAEARRGWQNFPLEAEGQTEYLAHFGAVLAPDHATRMNNLLWAGEGEAAVAMRDLVPEDARFLALARLALQTNADGVDVLIGAVPASLQNDPGLAYDRFQWRMNNKRRGEARALLMERSTSAAALGRPDEWAGQRFRLARDDLWEGKNERAYTIAANHFLEPGSDFARLEWLAGYIALRKLGRADLALFHFQRHGSAVDSPISLGRTHYWQARAWEVLGNAEAAQNSYRQGAQHQTSFYGLLAAEKLGMSLDPRLTGQEQFVVPPDARFRQSSVFEAGNLLIEAGHPRLGVRFLTHLAEGLGRTEIGQMAALAEADGNAYLELMLAKRGVQYGMLLERPYLPLHPVARGTGEVPPELALSISRRESEFLPTARSGVGARGLMQLMPPTAQEMAGKIGLPYDPSRLASDPTYNAQLGIAYLAELQRQFGRSPVQIAAAYNAGPSRPIRWMGKLGDPRRGEIDVIDFIEMIPFSETRNYVMRVTESLPAYRARLTGQVEPIRFTQELLGVYVVPTAATTAPAPASSTDAPTGSMRPEMRPDALATE